MHVDVQVARFVKIVLRVRQHGAGRHREGVAALGQWHDNRAVLSRRSGVYMGSCRSDTKGVTSVKNDFMVQAR